MYLATLLAVTLVSVNAGPASVQINTTVTPLTGGCSTTSYSGSFAPPVTYIGETTANNTGVTTAEFTYNADIGQTITVVPISDQNHAAECKAFNVLTGASNNVSDCHFTVDLTGCLSGSSLTIAVSNVTTSNNVTYIARAAQTFYVLSQGTASSVGTVLPSTSFNFSASGNWNYTKVGSTYTAVGKRLQWDNGTKFSSYGFDFGVGNGFEKLGASNSTDFPTITGIQCGVTKTLTVNMEGGVTIGSDTTYFPQTPIVVSLYVDCLNVASIVVRDLVSIDAAGILLDVTTTCTYPNAQCGAFFEIGNTAYAAVNPAVPVGLGQLKIPSNALNCGIGATNVVGISYLGSMTGAPTAPTAVTSPQITLTVVIGPNGCTYNPYDYTIVINDVSLSLSPSIVKLGTDLTLTLNGNKVSAKKKVTAIRIYSSNTPGLTTASPIDSSACSNPDKWCQVFGSVGSSCFKEVEQAPNEVITLGTALGSVNMNCAPDNPFAFVDASKLYYRFDVNWEATPGVPGPPNRRDVFSMLPAKNGSNSVVATIEMPMKEGISVGVVAGIVTASVAILAIGAIVILKRQKAKKNLDKQAGKNLSDETAEPFVTAL